MRAVDSSYDELTDQEAKCFKANNWALYIQCLLALPRTGPEQPPKRVISLRNALNNGLPIAGYIVLGRARPGPEYIDLGRAGVPDDIWKALKFVAVDVEVPGLQVDEISRAVERVEQLGKIAIIYTNYNTWKNYIVPGDDTRLARGGTPLWNASWDVDPDIDFVGLSFGGWKIDGVAIEQWAGGTQVCGQFVDRNTVVHPELIGLKEEAHMPTSETVNYEELAKRLDDLVNSTTAALTGLGSRIQSIQGALDTLTQTSQAARQALERHLREHNTSGGPTDRYSGQYLIEMAGLLDEMETKMRELAGRGDNNEPS